MRYFYVDYENVQSTGLEGLAINPHLAKKDLFIAKFL